MKNIFLFLTILSFLYSCKQEKVIATTKNEGFFKKEDAGKQATPPSFANTGANPAGVYMEFKELAIPMQVPTDQYPTWQAFSALLAQKHSSLTIEGQEYAAQLLLNGYQLYRQPYSEAVVQEITTQLNQLVTSKHKGYGLLYNCLVWLKNNDAAATAANLKTKILAYAKPILGPPNPNLPDSPEIVNNPGLKADMDRMIARVKENDSYIEKIRGL